MTREEARALLKLTPGDALSRLLVRNAWARVVKAIHPDTSSGYDAAAKLDELTRASKTLLDHIADVDLTCKACDGLGKVRASMGYRQCDTCKGTGERRQ